MRLVTTIFTGLCLLMGPIGIAPANGQNRTLCVQGCQKTNSGNDEAVKMCSSHCPSASSPNSPSRNSALLSKSDAGSSNPRNHGPDCTAGSSSSPSMCGCKMLEMTGAALRHAKGTRLCHQSRQLLCEFSRARQSGFRYIWRDEGSCASGAATAGSIETELVRRNQVWKVRNNK